jgi:hypothetical protein
MVTIAELIAYLRVQMPGHRSFWPVDYSQKVARNLADSIVGTRLSEAGLCDFISKRVAAYDPDIEDCRDLGVYLAKLVDLHIVAAMSWWRR